MKLLFSATVTISFLTAGARAQNWRVHRPDVTAAPHKASSQPEAGSFHVSSLVLYQSDSDLRARMPDGTGALGAYMNVLKAKIVGLFAASSRGAPTSGAIAIIIRSQQTTRSWLVLGENNLAPVLAQSLQHLVAVEPTPPLLGSVAFAIVFDAWGGGKPVVNPTRPAPIPSEWESAMRRSPQGIIDDVILDAIWPGEPGLRENAMSVASREQDRAACFQPDPDRAIASCTALIDAARESQENLGSAFLGRGNAFFAKGEPDRAIRDYGEAIRLNPNGLKAHINRGLAYASKSEFNLALQDDDEAIRLNPRSAEALNARCMHRAIIGQLQPAMRDCDEALRLRPGDPAILDSRGFTHLRHGQFAAAIADYSAVLASTPTVAESWFGRGIAYTLAGDRAQGGADMDHARQIDSAVATTFQREGVSVP